MSLVCRHRSFHGRCLTLALGVMLGLGSSACSDQPGPRARYELVAPYDPADGRTVRLHDLVMDQSAHVNTLAALEIQVVDGPRIDDRGRRIVSIRSTGMLAASLAPHGFVAEGHRRTVSTDPHLGVRTQATVSECNLLPIHSKLFRSFDDVGAPDPSIRVELEALDALPGVRLETLATTHEGRPVYAIRFSAEEVSSSPSPTVYVLAAHHAREWVTTEVVMRMVRWFASAATKGELRKHLGSASVVFVPVVNPDGYQYSRTVFRDQRRNRRNTCTTVNSRGVDINRNYTMTWGQPSDSMSSNGCVDTYIGPSPASEPETQGIEQLLAGLAFGEPRQTPAATISYHSYSAVVLYPEGYKESTDAQGPRCGLNDSCLNADFQMYRRVFGDFENRTFYEPTTVPPTPYPASQNNNLLYTVAGDITQHGQYQADVGHLTVTPELTGHAVNFYVECEPDADDIAEAIFLEQRDLILDLAAKAPGLVSSTTASALAPNEMGIHAPGMWVREASGGFSQESARLRWVKPVWQHSNPGPTVTVNVDGNAMDLVPLRDGNHYRLYYRDLVDITGDPHCIPCEIEVRDDQRNSDGMDCRGCIDLRDPDRLDHDGWKLVSGTRGGSDDYWWEPIDGYSPDATLYIGGGTPPAGATHCHLMFTTYSAPYHESTPVILERKDPGSGNWEELLRWPFDDKPVAEFRFEKRLRSEYVESNLALPAGPVDLFRFRVPAGMSKPDFQLFDPIIYCRKGGLP